MMLDRIGFHIGQDFAHYGRVLAADVHESIIAGYQQGLKEKGKWKSDRYINKWLQLRLNAYARGKLFSDQITPDYIRSLDAETCPITGVQLTHATGKDTDWSIDRIANDFDYIPSNLIVMSTRANKAKGDKSADRIIRISESTDANRDGLTADEWKRMAELVQWTRFRQLPVDELEKVDATELFIASLLKGEKPIHKGQYSKLAVFQAWLLQQLEQESKILPQVDKTLNRNKQAKLIFHKLWHRLIKRKSAYLPEEQYKQWANQTTLGLYVKWVLLHDINELGNFLNKYEAVEFSGPLEEIQRREGEYSE
jgi:hypothetical protein